jgi:hypothetical protein
MSGEDILSRINSPKGSWTKRQNSRFRPTRSKNLIADWVQRHIHGYLHIPDQKLRRWWDSTYVDKQNFHSQIFVDRVTSLYTIHCQNEQRNSKQEPKQNSCKLDIANVTIGHCDETHFEHSRSTGKTLRGVRQCLAPLHPLSLDVWILETLQEHTKTKG